MRNLRRRVEQLENTTGNTDGSCFLLVLIEADENREEALARTLVKDGLHRDRAGRVLFFDRVAKEMGAVGLLPNLPASVPDEREF